MVIIKKMALTGAAFSSVMLLGIGSNAAMLAAHRISPNQAKSAAVAKIPGKALSAKYEFEDGHWQYAVVVQKGTALYEVEVNAQSGKVTDTEKTSLKEEQSEAIADQKTAAKANSKK